MAVLILKWVQKAECCLEYGSRYKTKNILIDLKGPKVKYNLHSG